MTILMVSASLCGRIFPETRDIGPIQIPRNGSLIHPGSPWGAGDPNKAPPNQLFPHLEYDIHNNGLENIMSIKLWDQVKEPWAGFSRRDLFRQGGMLAAAQALGGSIQRAVAAPLEIG